jgi:signal recognition particle receptor subunit beta
MVLFNYSTKELTAKVVYYGPGLCGKTTNLQWVHEKLPIKNKGKMLSLATETDRTLFFDFLPIEIGSIRGMKTRIQLYTVPGQVFYNATRRMVLKGADAVVFVCDSQEAMLDANLESFENMRQNLEANEINPDEIPIVLQYNKRDLPNALPIEILNERVNPHNYPFYEAIAVTGIGVEDTLKAVTKLVFKSLSAKYGQTPPPTPGPGARPASLPGVPPVRAAETPAPAGLADGEEEDLLGDLAGGPGPAPEQGPPPVVVDEDHTPVSSFGRPVGRRASTPGYDPHGTLVSSRNEADELRRRIANPGIPEAEVEVSLEEGVDDADPTHASFLPRPLPPPRPSTPPPARAPEPTPPPAPTPSVEEALAESTEVEVPIDIEVEPGTTRVSLNLRLILNLKR